MKPIILKYLLSSLWLVSGILVADAQEQSNSFFSKNKAGITLSSLLNDYEGVQVHVAKGISHHADFQIEAGYIFDAPDRTDVHGWRLRAQPRFRIFETDILAGYLSPGFHHRYTKSNIENNFSRFGGAYYEQITHQEIKTITGGVMMMGLILKQNDQWCIDAGMGLGLGKMIINFKGVPNDAVRQPGPDEYFLFFPVGQIYRNEGRYNYLLAIFHVGVSYIF